MADHIRFAVPTTLVDALDALDDPGALALGGGTSIAMMLKQGFLDADLLVWLGRIPALNGIIQGPEGELQIGAFTSLASLARTEQLRQEHPVVAKAASTVANPRIRAAATVGGALVHADPRQDLPPALLAANARVDIQGPRGSRSLALDDGFFRGFLETAVEPDELVTHVVIPPSRGTTDRYVRFTPGSVDDYPTLSVAVRAGPAGDGAPPVRVALGGVDSNPVLVPTPRDMADITDAARLAAHLGDVAAASCSPHDDERGSAAYKQAMVRVWTTRAVGAALAEL